jgi:hypothetical protein
VKKAARINGHVVSRQSCCVLLTAVGVVVLRTEGLSAEYQLTISATFLSLLGQNDRERS